MSLAQHDDRDDIEADIRIDRTDQGRYRTLIKTRRGQDFGERTVESGTCAEAADAAVLIVAMLVGSPDDAPPPSAPNDAAPPMPEPREEPRALQEPPREAPRETPAEPVAESPPRRFDIALLGLGDAGSLPQTGIGATFAAGMRLGFARIEVTASHLPAQTATSAEEGKGGKVKLSTASLRAGVPFGRIVELTPAVGLEGGSISGEGYGVRNPMSDSALWLGLVGGASARWPARAPIGVRAGLDAVVPLNRKEFQLAGNTVHVAGAVVGRAMLGLDVGF